LATLGGAILAETSRERTTCANVFRRKNVNKVNCICAILLYIFATVLVLMPSAFSSPIKHFSELHVSCCPISFFLRFVLINAINWKVWWLLVIPRYFSRFSYCQMTISFIHHLYRELHEVILRFWHWMICTWT
jgi:hypothetical protein